jgi:hypothetical protein
MRMKKKEVGERRGQGRVIVIRICSCRFVGMNRYPC